MLAEYAPAKRRGVIASLVSLGHELGHARRVRALGPPAGRAVRGAAAQLGLAPAVPAQLRPADLRLVAAAEPQGEPGLRGAPRRRRRRRADPPRGRGARRRDARERPRGRTQAAQGQGVLPGIGSAVRPGRQLRARADLPRRLHRHRTRRRQGRPHPGDRLGLPARLRHRPGGRPARRPLRSPPGLHRAQRPDDRACLPAAAHDHQRQHRRPWCWAWSSR